MDGGNRGCETTEVGDEMGATLSKEEDKATSTSNIGLLMLVVLVVTEEEDEEAK